MAIVNVTPDSFSDGGERLDPAQAIDDGLRFVSEGADIVDVGGESTRPGSRPVDAGEELQRVLPVIEGLARRDVVVSIDPTGLPGSWSATNLIPFPPGGSQGLPFNALFEVSCPSVDFCAAVGSRGMIFTSGNPFDVEEARGGIRRGGPKRPRMKILRSDNFRRQSWTKGAGSRVTFRLRPHGRARGFICRLDGRRFRRCKSPLRIYAKVGRHVLRARAIGVTGLKGPVATNRFAIRLTR